MVFFLIFSFLCLIEKITPDNIKKIIGTNPHVPVFLAIVSQWCQHCQKMKPEWLQLGIKYKDDPNIIIGTIESDSFHNIGSYFPQYYGVPGLFWVSKTPDVSEMYSGHKTLEDFEQYIKEKLKSPIIQINNHSELIEYIDTHINDQIFLLQGEMSIEVQKNIEECLFWVKRFPIKFLHSIK